MKCLSNVEYKLEMNRQEHMSLKQYLTFTKENIKTWLPTSDYIEWVKFAEDMIKQLNYAG